MWKGRCQEKGKRKEQIDRRRDSGGRYGLLAVDVVGGRGGQRNETKEIYYIATPE